MTEFGTAKLRAAPMQPGTVLGDGTIVGDYVGRSSGALNFYGERPDFGRVVIKVLSPQLDAPLEAMADAMRSLLGVHHPGLQRLIGGGRVGPRNYLVYEFVDGHTLGTVLSQLAERGQPADVGLVTTALRSAADALETLHTVTAHGVLTAANIYLERGGALKLASPGYARLTLCGLGVDGDTFRGSPYLAPEVRDDPWAASEASDVYSLGVLAVALLAGRHVTADELPAVVAACAQRFPALEGVLLGCVVDEPVMRLSSVRALQAAIDAAGVGRAPDAARAPAAPHAPEPAARSPRGPTPPPLPSAPSIPVPPDPELSLGALLGGVELPDLPTLGPTESRAMDPERWLTRSGGRDFGPYSGAAIREMLTRDEIDEHTVIVDLFSQESAALIDVPVFTEVVMDYLPVRARRRIEQDERRKAVVKTAKWTGVTTVIGGALATAAAVGLAVLLHVDQPQVPLDAIVTPFPFAFEMNDPTYVEFQADDALIASLFDFSEPVPDPGRGPSGRGGAGDLTADGSEPEEPDLDAYVLNFDSTRPASKLTVDDLNTTLAANQAAIQLCFQRELRENPAFAGVTVRLSIVPDGRTTSVRVDARGAVRDETTACIRGAFRQMRFPEFNDVPMNVSFPFRLQ